MTKSGWRNLFVAKASNAELDMILETVIEMIIKGESRTDILRYSANAEHKNNILFGKSIRSIDDYIKKARTAIFRIHKPNRDKLKKISLARLENLYKKNYVIQDYRECRQIIESLAKMAGVNEPQRTELTGANGSPVHSEMKVTIIHSAVPIAESEEQVS